MVFLVSRKQSNCFSKELICIIALVVQLNSHSLMQSNKNLIYEGASGTEYVKRQSGQNGKLMPDFEVMISKFNHKQFCFSLCLITDCQKRRLSLHYFVLHKSTRPSRGVYRGSEVQDQKVQAGLRLEGGGGRSCHAILSPLLSFLPAMPGSARKLEFGWD